ncbi:MAG: YHS domain-containing protein, partial [Armatimonadetes bacterium]|nr:YHS domain-containing protein [Armatimonadota bacterium]
MGAKIASVKEAVGKSTYKGKTYYFCCAGCKPEFDKNPEKFIKSTSKDKNKKVVAETEKEKTEKAEEIVCAVRG